MFNGISVISIKVLIIICIVSICDIIGYTMINDDKLEGVLGLRLIRLVQKPLAPGPMYIYIYIYIYICIGITCVYMYVYIICMDIYIYIYILSLLL